MANAQHQRQASLGSNGQQKQVSSQIRMKDNSLYDKRGRNSKGQLMFHYLGHNTQFAGENAQFQSDMSNAAGIGPINFHQHGGQGVGMHQRNKTQLYQGQQN